MNQKLVESLAQIILSLSDEERQWLDHEVRQVLLAKQIEDLKLRLAAFEETYQMSSPDFYQRFQAGQLGDSSDFFEWNTYYEMLTASSSEVA